MPNSLTNILRTSGRIEIILTQRRSFYILVVIISSIQVDINVVHYINIVYCLILVLQSPIKLFILIINNICRHGVILLKLPTC